MITLNKVNPEDFPAVDNLFQSAFWGKFKAACGQQAVFFLCEYENSVHEKLDFPLLVLLRKAMSVNSVATKLVAKEPL